MSASSMLFLPALFLSALCSSVSMASTGGVIYFEGAIVESPCDVSIDAHKATVACDRQGQAKTQQFSLQKLTQEQSGLGNLVTMKINYLNPAHTLAVMDITYN
ncbi:TPA: type 1 fimbrial protein [Kluyvera intermedia]|nr:type 1 fimbrial protein [Kluyvera intermedia]